MSSDGPVDAYFSLSSALHPSPARLKMYLDRLFHGVPLVGRRMLDVGGGSGMMTFYGAARGARVTCLEPAAEGSNPRMEADYSHFATGLHGLVDVSLERETLQSFEPPGTYDVVLLHNSVNHLDEDACVRLQSDPAAQKRYRVIFEKLSALTAPGGDLIMADCARLNLFGLLGLRNPLAPDIDWQIHQQPRLWARLLEEAGFGHTRIRWNIVTTLGKPGQLVLGNWVGGFVTNSHFILTMRRAG